MKSGKIIYSPIKAKIHINFLYIYKHFYFVILQIVFGTGDKLQAITVTSNGSFVRAAREQVPQQNPFFSCLKKLPLYIDVLVPASTISYAKPA